ncbi:MAG TPA: M1 family aminopeptidase [Noviherbaspirillum sp.]|uniref:M1 family metallopeptidase n=1 Tax=Noviherbaspirillum sp. TaxID=1926288 RepID=UPI002B49822D|nr:M1 family aminopeptidase [Noviherbaspirillum sp.]HJV87455.1 M1 family aminopeptidase [Noviherbaspirillum sp.]
MSRLPLRHLLGLLFVLLFSFVGATAHAVPALDLHVELNPGTHEFKAYAELRPPPGEFQFALHESLQVTSAAAGGKPLQVFPAGREGALRAWRVTLPPGARTLRIDYGGTLPPLDRSLDHRGVLHGLPPMASQEGSFLPAGSGWYPQPAPLFAYRVALSVPAGQRALVAGHLLSEDVPNDTTKPYRANFEFPQPADGIDLMAGPWIVHERMVPRTGAEGLRLRTYFPRELDAMPGLAAAYLEDTQRYIDLYSRQIGDYPFKGFSIVASPLPTGFGMPSLTYIGAEVLKLPFIRATSLGHEILHDWWGNGVYVDYEGGNWSEGLTTFMADYAYKERESAAAAREMRLAWLRDFAAVPPGDQQTLRGFRSRTHGAEAAIGYGKSAMLFVMLRDMIGEEAFVKGIRTFWHQHRFRSASWDDLRLAFEHSSGKPLGDFFQQWLARAGGPTVTIADASLASGTANETGKKHVQLVIEQSEPPYALRLPVELVYANRTEMRRVDVSHTREQISLDVDAPPQGVRIDPDLRIWRVLEHDQLPPILRQWFIARAPRLAIVSPQLRTAADELARRLFENPPQAASLAQGVSGTEPMMLIGLHADVDAALAQAGLPPRPKELDGKGSAQVWTVPGSRVPLAVVSAADADALRALLRPLPHYGAQSWLVFEGSHAAARGVWPAPGKMIKVRAAK